MEAYKKWLGISERELKAAEMLGQAGFHAEACFWCQQAVEKALKGLLVFQGKEFSKTHSLISLAKDAGVLKELRQWIGHLDADYAATRYVVVIENPEENAYDDTRFKQRFEAASKSLGLIRKWMKT